MPTFPTFTRAYTHEAYSYEITPEVSRTQYYTGRSRQRKLFQNRDDTFNVRLVLSDSELETFENFVTTDLENGSLTYDGPYFTSDAEYTGTLEMIDGQYGVELIPPNSWAVSFAFELKNRDMTDEDVIYDAVVSFGTFESYCNTINALDDLVNGWPLI